eukprot:3222144-Rhodomonas_salina.2
MKCKSRSSEGWRRESWLSGKQEAAFEINWEPEWKGRREEERTCGQTLVNLKDVSGYGLGSWTLGSASACVYSCRCQTQSSSPSSPPSHDTHPSIPASQAPLLTPQGSEGVAATGRTDELKCCASTLPGSESNPSDTSPGLDTGLTGQAQP